MSTDVDELAWMAEHRPLAPDPDAATTDRAYAALSRHISIASSARRRRRRRRLTVRIGVAATVLAVAITFVLVGPTTSSHPGAAPGGMAASQSGVVTPVLYRLASSIAKSPSPPGNATLVIARTTFYGPQRNHRPTTAYSLLEDTDSAYGGTTLAELRHSMRVTPSRAARDSLIAAAAASASANISPAQAAANIRRALPEPKTFTQAQRDALLWADASGIFWGGAGHPDVRAGVLKALATLPHVHTKAIVYHGRDVLQITDSRAPLGFYGPTDTPYTTATVAIDARTGDLVYSTLPGETTQFQTRRVDAPSLAPIH